jgi:O-antigen/teichoic acid export membrane protein
MVRIHFVNAVSGVMQVAANIVLTMMIVPMFIHKLGLSTYGIYALITAIGSLGVFTNFGFNTSLIKYLTEQNDREGSNYDIIVTLIVMGGSALLIALILLVYSNFVLIKVLNLPVDKVTPSVFFFYVACIISNIFLVITQVPSAILDSKQKIYITNGVQLGVGVLNKILILGSLMIAPSLFWIGVIMMTSSISSMVLLFRFAIKVWGKITFPMLKTQFKPVVRKHFIYSRTVYATSIMSFFYEPVTKALISHYLGLVEVGYFDIALRMKGIVLSISERLLYPVMPLFASKKNLNEIRNLHDDVQKKIMVIIVPIIVLTIFMSKQVISLWLGSILMPAIISVIMIVSCFALTQLFVPLYQFLQIKGYPQKTFIMQLTNVSVNIILFILIVPSMGYYGALLAYCVAII